MIPPSKLEQLAERNLIATLREHARFSAGGEFREFDDALMAFGGTRFPAAPFNAVIRKGAVTSPASHLLDRADQQFGQRGRRFSVYVRARADDDLARECLAREYLPSGKLTTMVLERPAAGVKGPSVEWIEDLSGVERFVALAEESFESVAVPRAVTRSALSAKDQLLRPEVRLVVSADQAAALSIAHCGTEGIYWVGTIPSARGRGLARACVTTLVESALARGARCVVVQAAPKLVGFYRALGFFSISQLDLYTNLKVAARTKWGS